MEMTIKKRLRLSNMLMLLIPIAVAIVMGTVSVAVFFAIMNGYGGFALNEENFYNGKDFVIATIDDNLSESDPKERLNLTFSAADPSHMRVIILENDNEFYEYGNANDADDDLLDHTEKSKNGFFLSDGTRQLYRKVLIKGTTEYDVCIFCDSAEVSFTYLKITTVIVSLVFIVIVIISVVLSNKFLHRFVFRKINEPLDKLLTAAREVSSGNLDHKIEFNESNEFKPVIDEFNRMTDKLKNSVKQIKEEEENRKMLVVGITHDIKSPLTSVTGYAEGLLDGVAKTKQKQKSYLEGIKRKCAEIDSLVSKMIVLTKSDCEFTENTEEININAAIENFITESGVDYSDRGVEITCSLNTVLNIKCTQDDFGRVLTNIADNAVKYKKDERGRLHITLDENADEIRLGFADNGQGVEENVLPHIFDPFFRADKARTSTASGNGLGLAIVKKIISAAGGDVSACNNDKGGLTVFAVFKR